ncbi:hypothetical protein MNBD_ALPHA03-840 [hydrothermal vent metagenome]|uniref:Phage protein n=1 Tax=hydrothermal vent metagenome TaxID=652676 RepID=A0A3B1APL5_9ZZZZ
MTRSMHQKITCQKQIFTPISAGEQLQGWQDVATVWADVKAKSNDAEITARQIKFAGKYKIHVRYQDILLSVRRILWQGQAYRVVSFLNPDNRKRILEFDVVEDQS